jgi:hypothetical protein
MSNFYDETEKALKKIDEHVTFVAAKMKLGGKLEPEYIFFDTKEMMNLMSISHRTLQIWRDNRVIGFSQIGNKIYYSLVDIQKLMKDNYNPKI